MPRTLAGSAQRHQIRRSLVGGEVPGPLRNFGYETIGAAGFQNFGNRIRGSIFTIPENGKADSITWYGRFINVGTAEVKCAIYRHSDLSLVGVTEEITGPHLPLQWNTNIFPYPKPNLFAGTVYILVAWGNSVNNRLYFDVGDANQGHDRVQVYNGFPDPLIVDFHNTDRYSIYCSYRI